MSETTTETDTETDHTNSTGDSDENLQGRTTSAVVANVGDLEQPSMKMVEVGEHKIALIRTSRGVHALDNACPHQGYGLVTGTLSDESVTCQWHNWKFDAATGHCLLGEEDVARHRVTIDDQGQIEVEVTEPTPAELRSRLWPSLQRGLAADYVGQVSRDSLRLLDAGATPAQIMAEALAMVAPQADYGLGHELAMAADCLALAEVRSGDERLLPLVQGLSGLSEETRDRPATKVPAPDASVDFVSAIEGEDAEGAMASVVGQLERGAGVDEIRRQFIQAASAHHRGYGHGVIYTQKSFEILERIGWDQAAAVLPHLAESLVYMTREDTLPYMKKAMRALAGVDLVALAAAPDRNETGWSDPGLAGSMLGATEPPIELAARTILDGAGVEGLLDTVTDAVSLRLLAYDPDVEFEVDEPFGWLDITHGLTLAQAARWAWRANPDVHSVRIALFAAWLLFDTGRLERRRRLTPPLTTLEQVVNTFGVDGVHGPDGAGAGGAVRDAVLGRRPQEAVALTLGSDLGHSALGLSQAALADRAGSFIVIAHLIKTAEAASREALVLESPLPLAATARFLAAPRLERFVARNVGESIDFIRTGRPPRR